MPKRDLIIFSNRPTESGRLLARELDARYLREQNRRKLKRTDGALVVNWGSTQFHSAGARLAVPRLICLNVPTAVQRACSKVESYRAFQGAGVPTFEFTTEVGTADGWVNEGITVLCRREAQSSGRGISIGRGNIPNRGADFYTKYFPKTHEYRVHVFRGAIIDVTQKRRRTDPAIGEAGDDDRTLEERIIRSLDNGWVHCHDNIHLVDAIRDTSSPDSIGSKCCDSVAILGLDFGAVDLLVRCSKKHPERIKDFRIAEVNTAPGLGNERTIAAYTQAILHTYANTAAERKVVVPVRRRVRKMVEVWIMTKKGARVKRQRERWVYEKV